MIENLVNWLQNRFVRNEAPPTAQTTPMRTVTPPQQAKTKSRTVDDGYDNINAPDSLLDDSLGSGKNALIRNRFIREDTGTHETLTIVDDSILDSGEESGIDPYNTGAFDRSKSWSSRSRK